jgi:hypothetical protein
MSEQDKLAKYLTLSSDLVRFFKKREEYINTVKPVVGSVDTTCDGESCTIDLTTGWKTNILFPDEIYEYDTLYFVAGYTSKRWEIGAELHPTETQTLEEVTLEILTPTGFVQTDLKLPQLMYVEPYLTTKEKRRISLQLLGMTHVFFKTTHGLFYNKDVADVYAASLNEQMRKYFDE